MKNFLIAVCVLLAVALAKLPYGYYTFLRIAVCAYCVFACIGTIQRSKTVTFSALILGSLAILYNPLFKIYATRDFWTVVNIATIVILVIIYFRGSKR